MPLCAADSDSSSGGEVEDDDAENLSHVGEAAYDVLRKKHNRRWHELWNVTSGIVIDEVHQTPWNSWPRTSDPDEGHDDWFPKKLCEIISRTQIWCDIMSLGPPDGLFLAQFKLALANVCRTANDGRDPIIIRMMFGNIVGMPVNCHAVINELTADLDPASNIQLWVGAWRKGCSWNHAKIIAVDGHYLHTGGHNLWDQHYLKQNPVHDLSMEAEGRVAHDGHLYANHQWQFVEHNQRGLIGYVVSKLPDNLPTILQTRVTVSEWPEGIDEFPPVYEKVRVPHHKQMDGHVPIISMGRYGSMLWRARPSDDAIVAMLDSAQTCIKFALQDLGPICLPGTKIAVPGCVWPREYMSAMGRKIMDNVEVKIALSNPGSIPGGLSPMDALYGNGWTCDDVASEILKTIKDQFDDVTEQQLIDRLEHYLKVCYIKEKRGKTWQDGKTMGMHAKHFIVDDICYYIGSQNLYIADLAEWGLVIDDDQQCKKVMQEYWNPMWEFSYKTEDCSVEKVIGGLDVERDGKNPMFADKETREQMEQAQRQQAPGNVHLYGTASDSEDE